MANQTRTYNPKALKMSYLGVPIEDGLNTERRYRSGRV